MTFEMNGNQVVLDGRRIGWITKTLEGKRVFRSPRKVDAHKMRIYDGWGISEELLQWLKENEFAEVQIQIGTMRTLIADVHLWLEKGIRAQYQNFEPQIFLQEKHFKEIRLTQGQLMENPSDKL
jgi:hypothetical protein